ncbi:MAG: DUF4982 domain-containing protein [Lachnospiraceae bacterium]|nr:DUF4982 domain-containing protein [Lachnospiraceae bacterium]
MRKLFNDGWEFTKQPVGSSIEAIESYSFEKVNIPHDWMIYQVDALYEDSTGIYRKNFSLKKDPGMRYEIYFEGVYMDTTVYVNGKEAGVWKYGYSSFFFDITELLTDGDNSIVVRSDYRSPNTRWYSGAGIYRDVFFISHPAAHLVTDSLYVSAKPLDEQLKDWELKVSAELAGEVKSVSLDIPALGIKKDADVPALVKEESAGGVKRIEFCERVSSPRLWSLEEPALYELKLSLDNGDEQSLSFGFRHFVCDCDKGFFLNGEHVKINGVCEHHDLGALGAAFNKCAFRRKLDKLRSMGVNAVRTSHNMPAVGLLDLCDEMGFLVMDESFDMWEGPKTEYDYARFFKEWHERDVRSWVRRDRSHPCVFMWSIGNEIYDTHKDEHGVELTKMLMDEVRANDLYENAVVGIGSNYMPWQGAQNCADVLKFAGYNYAEKFYDKHHAEHPDWHIFGSETASTVQSRGIYHFPYSQATLSEDDKQCSSLGNSTTGWGAPSSEYCVIAERDHDFSLGQFLWTGFDYIGEPTPYDTRNSYFGQIDTAGFPKDSYYIYRSAWTDVKKAPFVHVFPYWDFNPGQQVDVRIASNASDVELFLNGRSLGRKTIDHAHGTVLTADYIVVYEPGEIKAVAYDENGEKIAEDIRRSFGDSAEIKLVCENDSITAGCGELAFIEVSAADADGNPVENAADLLEVKVEGAGYLAGLDNGDSTDTDEYKGCHKRLFSGKALIIVGTTDEAGDVNVTVSSKGLKSASCVLHVLPGEKKEGMSYLKDKKVADKTAVQEYVRKIELVCEGSRTFTKGYEEISVSAKLYPEKAQAGELIWKAVNDAGIESNIAKIASTEGGCAKIKAIADGNFRLRCETKCGSEVARVISVLEFNAEGLGTALLDPYGFIAGGLYSYNEGEVGMGNDHGVSTARLARGVVGYENIDFGSWGSDEVTIPIFALSNDPFPLQLWEGIPEKEGSTLLCDAVYHKKMIWNQYQSDTFKLCKRLKGVSSLYIVTQDKAHIGGFSFAKFEKAYQHISGGECDNVYGDSFDKKADRIDNIGNNVTVEFYDMDFGDEGADSVIIGGVSHIPVNTIHIIFDDKQKEVRDILEFKADGGEEQCFDISGYKGKGIIRIVFLPGSSFDLVNLQFCDKMHKKSM